MLHLAGLPVTDEMVKLGNKPSTSLKIKSLLKIATPSKRTKLKMILDKCVEEGLPTT